MWKHRVGDLVVECIDDRVGIIIEIKPRRKGAASESALVLMESGEVESFPIYYLGRYK